MGRGLVLLFALGCQAESPPAVPASSPAAPAPSLAAPASSAATSEAPPAPGAQDPPQKSVAERKARYEGRPVVTPPATLPKSWAAAIAGLDGRLTAVEADTWAAPGSASRHVAFEMRLWGLDAAVDARVLRALKAAGVPQVAAQVPSGEVVVDDVTWSLTVDHLVAPPGEPREALVAFEWARAPKPGFDRPNCTTPEPVAPPVELPKALAKLTEPKFLRRRVGVSVSASSDGPLVRQWILYRNGYAMDDNVAEHVAQAKKLGYHHEDGEGPKQRWTLPDGSRIGWRVTREDPVIGCIPEGPMLIIEWKGPTP